MRFRRRRRSFRRGRRGGARGRRRSKLRVGFRM